MIQPKVRHRHLLALRLLGVLALLVHLQASAAMLGMGMGGDGPVICTAQGMVSIADLGGAAPESMSPHTCCDLCGACTAPAIGQHAGFGFGAPTIQLLARVSLPAVPRAPPAEYAPQAPRGPPTHS